MRIFGVKAALAAGVVGFMTLGAAGTQAAVAQSVGPDVHVRYADLDITTAAGAEKLYERIQQAAALVCPQADARWLAQYVTVVRCRNTVVAHAVQSLSNPQLTAVYAARAHHAVRSPA
jgi:UrcA family protein